MFFCLCVCVRVCTCHIYKTSRLSNFTPNYPITLRFFQLARASTASRLSINDNFGRLKSKLYSAACASRERRCVAAFAKSANRGIYGGFDSQQTACNPFAVCARSPRANKGRQGGLRAGTKSEQEDSGDPRLCACNARFPGVVVLVLIVIVVFVVALL